MLWKQSNISRVSLRSANTFRACSCEALSQAPWFLHKSHDRLIRSSMRDSPDGVCYIRSMSHSSCSLYPPLSKLNFTHILYHKYLEISSTYSIFFQRSCGQYPTTFCWYCSIADLNFLRHMCYNFVNFVGSYVQVHFFMV